MTMKNPALALLWESWRLSRLFLAVMVFLATLVGAALIVSPVESAWSARLALVLATYFAFIGQAWANNVDSRKGFSMTSGFARPIPTWVLVSVPMAYIGITCAVTYLVSVLILRAAFGIALPLLPAAAFVGTLSLATVAFNWWKPSVAVRAALGLGLGLVMLYFAKPPAENELSPDRLPELFAFSAWMYGSMALIAAGAIGVAIVGVARQRRGDDGFTLSLPAGRSADAPARTKFRAWIADRLRVPCPTSSPTRAQLWLEVYTVGGRVLATGVLIALAAPVIPEVAGFLSVEVLVFNMMLWGFLLPLIVGLRRVLGVRRKQGISYLSAFTATLPMGTARLIGLKVLVTSVAMLGAWAAVATSLWLFAEYLAVWGPRAQAVFADFFLPSLPPSVESLGIAASVLIYVTAGVACASAFHTLLLLSKKRVLLSGLGIGLYIASIVAMGIRGWVDGGAMVTLHLYIIIGALYLGTISVFRRALAERLITRRGLIGVLALSVPALWAVFTAMTWLGQNAEAPYLDEVMTVVTLALVPVATIALAPWSFSRIRHQ